MSSFFEYPKPKMLDVKKKLNTTVKSDKSEELPSTAPSTTAANPFITPSTDSAPGMSESWVELAPSRTSLCSSVDINMIVIDDKDKDSRLSPISVQSPHVEFESLEQVKYRLVREMLPPGKNTDWIWDWSSRPENVPPKNVRMRQYGSNLTTPPNSPEPDLYHCNPLEPSSIFDNVQAVVGFIVTNLFSFVIGAAVGYAVCRRFARPRPL